MDGQPANPHNTLMTLGRQGFTLSTSLDLTNPQNRVTLLKAMQDCDFRLTEHVNMPFDATDYVAHKVMMTSKESGEVVEVTRLVIVDTQGKTYQCVAETLLQSIQTVAFAYGPPPWANPITLTVRTKKRGERSIYWFDATKP